MDGKRPLKKVTFFVKIYYFFMKIYHIFSEGPDVKVRKNTKDIARESEPQLSLSVCRP